MIAQRARWVRTKDLAKIRKAYPHNVEYKSLGLVPAYVFIIGVGGNEGRNVCELIVIGASRCLDIPRGEELCGIEASNKQWGQVRAIQKNCDEV